MKEVEKKHFMQLLMALKRITKYQTVERLKRNSQKDWGLSSDEAIEMAYENVIAEAKAGLKSVRVPRDRVHPSNVSG